MLRPNLYDYLKILALVTMIIDHVGYFLYPEMIWLRVVGRVAFPLFLVLVGYNCSYRQRRSLRLPVIIIQLLIWIAYRQWYAADPMIQILLVIASTRVVLQILQQKSLVLQGLTFLCSLILTPLLADAVDYGMLGVSFGILGLWMRTRSLLFATRASAWLIIVYMLFMIADRWFPEQTRGVLAFLGLLLVVCFVSLAKNNTVYRIGAIVDRGVLRVSTHALRIYIVHWLLLFVLAQYL